MPSADQVPVKSTASPMHWHMWVILIAGSTASASRAVRLPNFTSRRLTARAVGEIFSRSILVHN
jgi:hypothetical protein